MWCNYMLMYKLYLDRRGLDGPVVVHLAMMAPRHADRGLELESAHVQLTQRQLPFL